jgi:hypothetical protein
MSDPASSIPVESGLAPPAKSLLDRANFQLATDAGTTPAADVPKSLKLVFHMPA